jgi:serine carboxypeptidase-like clade IV
MFYFFFESRDTSKDDPVVIWLTGGPGCGSELALFYENGPFQIADDLSLVWNDFGWDKVIKTYSTLRKYTLPSLSKLYRDN